MKAFSAKPFTTEGPQPLIRDVPDTKCFPVSALGALQPIVEALAEVTEAPLAMCAASCLAAAAMAVQGLADCETLAGSKPCSLFLLTVAESGERKSTSDNLAMKGVRAFEASLKAGYAKARVTFEHEHGIWEKRRAAIMKTADAKPDGALAELLALGDEPIPPLLPQIVAGSPTMEGIIKNLPQLRASLGIMTDEGGQMLGGYSMKSETKLATLATLAKMWDGATLDRWRAGDGIEAYAGRRFSIHFLIQPEAVAAFLSDPLANGQGLVARFLVSRPASHIGTRLRLTRDEASEAKLAGFAARIEELLALPLALAEQQRNELAPPILLLDEDTRAVLTDFARAVEREQAQGGQFEHARAFASKTAEHAARLAAVLTLVRDPEALRVTAETMADAVTLATFYANEAARLTDAAVVPKDVQDAERMRFWLLASWGEENISVRAASRLGPFKLTKQTRAALELLAFHGWLIKEPGATVQGRPCKEAWRIVREAGK